MSEINGSIDVIVISSSDDEDEYQESDYYYYDDDDDEEAEESGVKRSGSGGEKKGPAGDVSPSSVEVKTVGEKSWGGQTKFENRKPPTRFRSRFTSPSEIKGSIDVIVISSSDDEDDYQESDDDEEEEAEESGVKRSGNGGEKKGAAGDVSPSSVEMKTADEKKMDDDDCYILDFDPFDSTAADLENKLSLVSGNQEEEEDVFVLAEKGEVACRDFPHARHMCAAFLFDKTSHESYCAQCYCYVCDTPAPCAWWKASLHSHCHASDQQLLWKNLRSVRVKGEVKSNS